VRKGRDEKDDARPVAVPIEGVLDLHTFLPKEVPSLLEEYLHACQDARIYSVRIIHGKGKGIQKTRVRALLKKLPMVASFSDAPGSAGGWGATIVEMRKERPPSEQERNGFFDSIDKGARAMGRPLDPAHIKQFAVHAEELLEWNRFANLTAVTDLEEMAEKHFLDAVPLASLVPSGSHVLDIGSGGGFPGLPLKVMRPDLEVCLIEASRKKANFLRHVMRTMGLKGIEARHVRADELAREVPPEGGPYNVIVSRAASKLERLVDHALPLLSRQGMIIAMKGMSVDTELQGAKARIKAEGLTVQTETYRLPRLGLERSLVILRST
jgi:16S rRNA (guanine527-N7)-methyltransferase